MNEFIVGTLYTGMILRIAKSIWFFILAFICFAKLQKMSTDRWGIE